MVRTAVFPQDRTFVPFAAFRLQILIPQSYKRIPHISTLQSLKSPSGWVNIPLKQPKRMLHAPKHPSSSSGYISLQNDWFPFEKSHVLLEPIKTDQLSNRYSVEYRTLKVNFLLNGFCGRVTWILDKTIKKLCCFFFKILKKQQTSIQLIGCFEVHLSHLAKLYQVKLWNSDFETKVFLAKWYL